VPTPPRLAVLAVSPALPTDDHSLAWAREHARLFARGARVVLLDAAPDVDAEAWLDAPTVVRFGVDGVRRVNRRMAEPWAHHGSGHREELRAQAVREAAAAAAARGWEVTFAVLLREGGRPDELPRRLLDRDPGAVAGATYVPPGARDPRAVVWLDTETTGLGPPEAHAVIELAAVATDPTSSTVYGVFERKIAIPEWVVPNPVSLRVNRYHERDWSGARAEAEVARELAAWLPARAVLAGHNVAFDRRFVAAMLARHGLPEPGWRHVLDTRAFAAALKKRGAVPDCHLATVAASLGVPLRDAHTAYADAEAARRVYLALRRAEEPAETDEHPIE
jgi:DNA polymerase III epsilon subunit-like protein